jgi:hypothetical protein
VAKAATRAEQTARVRARLPLEAAWRWEFRGDPVTVEVVVRWLPAHAWEGSPSALSGRWRSRRIGPFVVAVLVRAWLA